MDKRYSGKFNLRIPPWLHKEMVEEASERGMSLNDIVIARIERARGHQFLTQTVRGPNTQPR